MTWTRKLERSCCRLRGGPSIHPKDPERKKFFLRHLEPRRKTRPCGLIARKAVSFHLLQSQSPSACIVRLFTVDRPELELSSAALPGGNECLHGTAS